MKILIIGSGGREHALGVKLKENAKVTELFFATGNGGTAQIGTNIVASTIDELCDFAKSNSIDLTIVGSEDLLVAGIVDIFHENGLKIFGPHKEAAQLEGNKAFAKTFMQKYGVKTASYKTFTDYKEALNHLSEIHYPTVVKASGLAAGKGVIIAQNKQEAEKALHEIMQDKVFGDSGSEVLIEEFLEGVEASILSYYNGKEIVPFISAKDHKKIGEGETGLNTGGMGVVAPNPYVTGDVIEKFQKNILKPTLKGLVVENLQFSGVIFFGLMITKKGVYLLEYNLRMGDPETQAVLPLLESDLLTLTENAIDGKEMDAKWKNQHSCCVVMVSGGYPQGYKKGHLIQGLEYLDTTYFIAGAQEENNELRTSGGRVLNIVATATTAEEARKKAYEQVEKVHFVDSFYRKDIGDIT
ncbi:phosphoribosylamine--glycine ligase [Balneicella halophila]|uniref:Phosphoribosylamine--glycine ligase n=1 Tax=Balneicella halophila TaxID=1537566 RepID=A0A7L4UTE0_BALHA|nr:phosphoribosylamine--glycine ligase [Balneicella halophila]PVX52374.1 phosphoribosylamine--glycine ligase [Balneicella halophila]